MRSLTYAKAILEGTDAALAANPKVYLMGLGVPDPKGIFGTTKGLQEKYGPKRVMDMPTSENAMTGVAIGSAILGSRPIITHQRVDFFFLALDQLINNAAKWHYMFGEQMKVPLVIRLIMGRGWGQGPQHSQSLHSMLAHIPKLKVIMPSNPYDAKGMIMAAVQEDHPVISIEHRWLYHIEGNVPASDYTSSLHEAKIVKEGTDCSLIACSHMTVEAHRAAVLLEKEGISAEIIDLRSINPLDQKKIVRSVKKTKRAVILDPDWKSVGLSAEIMAIITETCWKELKNPPLRITYPDQFVPTSWVLSNHYYPTHKKITFEVLRLFDKKINVQKFLEHYEVPLDKPDPTFTGPF